MQIKYTASSLKKRITALSFCAVFLLSLIVARLFYLQILGGTNLQARGLSQWLRDLPITAKRGTIYDRNGVALASSYTSYDCYVRKADMQNEQAVAQAIASATDLTSEEIIQKIDKYNYSEILIEKQLSKEQVQKVLASYQDGIFFTATTTRSYNYDNLLCQILGFLSSDGDGQSGIEMQYNSYLKGIDGVSLVETDIRGKTLDNSLTYCIDSIDGLDIHLTIDFLIQQKVEQILLDAKNNTGAKNLSALVMNPQTGEIISICTQPGFNLNSIDRNDMQTLNELSRSSMIADTYEPGSTFKVIVTAIALNEGLTSREHYYYCGGARIINGVRIKCSRRSGHGSQTLQQGLNNSCNCVFMDLISQIGFKKFYWYLRELGLTKTYGLDFPGETKAVLMPEEMATDADLARMGFGQTIAISGLELVNSICACINGGNVMQPYLVKDIQKNTGEIIYQKQATILKKVFKPSVSKLLNTMLEEVVSKGSGRHARIDGYNIAGKTGTAQKYENGAIAQGKYIASFVGYYPADKPEYIVLVTVDEPQGAYYGGIVAGPVAQQIFEAIITLRFSEQQANEAYLYSQKEATIEIPSVIGKTLAEAGSMLASQKLQYLVSGDGTKVASQIAAPGTQAKEGDIVLLIME